ncbi:hypothetical protein CY35_07G089000 [Sphagnum magellanicum]|uniref:Uncharacterized protein n=1 Tax=Sphagnum magellanicum TaxID=128215 RepID=A0ACB8HP81_9BRYO|nr:hypothetical protein CY35_07G089000 [Sphagnum magellanicum]
MVNPWLLLHMCLHVCFEHPSLCILLALCTQKLDGAYCDPSNLVQNGDFQVQSFLFGSYPTMDVISSGIRTLMPFWVAAAGGFQVLDATVFVPPPGLNASFLIHMNYRSGPGELVSMPIYTLREGAIYTVSFFIADNPDGGPVAKAVRLGLQDIYGRNVAPPGLSPFMVSNSSTTRNSILWQLVSCNVRGTGVPTILSLSSLTPGSFGALVANLQVNLQSMIENGSFENVDPQIQINNLTYFAELTGPSSLIRHWVVETGVIKIATAARYQASTDNTATLLDLNAENSPATISNIFSARSNTDYTLLFDTAANPERNFQLVIGQLVVTVQGLPSTNYLLSETVNLDSTSFSIDSIGWVTMAMEFKTFKDDFQVKVTFRSKIAGSFGPLLDNVQVFENTKSLKSTNETKLDGIPNTPPTITTPTYISTPTTTSIAFKIACPLSTYLVTLLLLTFTCYKVS